MPTDGSDPSQSSHTHADVITVRFNVVLGNIGASLRDDSSIQLEDSEDGTLHPMLDHQDFEVLELQSSEDRAHVGVLAAKRKGKAVEDSGPSRNPTFSV